MKRKPPAIIITNGFGCVFVLIWVAIYQILALPEWLAAVIACSIIALADLSVRAKAESVGSRLTSAKSGGHLWFIPIWLLALGVGAVSRINRLKELDTPPSKPSVSNSSLGKTAANKPRKHKNH